MPADGPSFSAPKGFLGWFCSIKVTYRAFQSPESQFKNSYHFRLTTSWNRSFPEDSFRPLVYQFLFRFRLVLSRDLATLVKSTHAIWPFAASHLVELGQSRNCWVEKNAVADS
jgi:hypothetical protein